MNADFLSVRSVFCGYVLQKLRGAWGLVSNRKYYNLGAVSRSKSQVVAR